MDFPAPKGLKKYKKPYRYTFSLIFKILQYEFGGFFWSAVVGNFLCLHERFYLNCCNLAESKAICRRTLKGKYTHTRDRSPNMLNKPHLTHRAWQFLSQNKYIWKQMYCPVESGCIWHLYFPTPKSVSRMFSSPCLSVSPNQEAVVLLSKSGYLVEIKMDLVWN